VRSQFVDRTADLPGAVERMARRSSVAGVAVLAAAGDPLPDGLDGTLRGLSVPVFGGVFPEVIHRGAKHATGAVVVGLASEPTVTTVEGLPDPDTQVAADAPDGGTAFVVVDAYTDGVDEFVTSLFRRWGVDVSYLGGGAGSLDGGGRPCVFTNDGVVADAATVAVVDASSAVGVRHGWREVAGPLQITAASGRRLSELEGDPAFEVYRRVVEDDAGTPVDRDGFFDVAKSYPFGLSRLDDEKIVRDPFEVEDDGSLVCFGDVPEGEFVHVLRGDPEALVEAAGEAHEAALARAGDEGTVFFFDCISRVLFLEEAFDAELDAVGGPDSPRLGALTIGEIANDGEGHLDYYNKTAVVAVVEER
jgi:hypothetical protein